MSHEVAILHSAFCLLHSRGGLGVVWYWSGGGLTWVAQGFDIARLTKLAMWLCVRSCASGIDGEGTANARRVPDVDRVSYWS